MVGHTLTTAVIATFHYWIPVSFIIVRPEKTPKINSRLYSNVRKSHPRAKTDFCPRELLVTQLYQHTTRGVSLIVCSGESPQQSTHAYTHTYTHTHTHAHKHKETKTKAASNSIRHGSQAKGKVENESSAQQQSEQEQRWLSSKEGKQGQSNNSTINDETYAADTVAGKERHVNIIIVVRSSP